MKPFHTAPPDPQYGFQREMQLFGSMHTDLIVSLTIPGKEEPEAQVDEMTGGQDAALQRPGAAGGQVPWQ